MPTAKLNFTGRKKIEGKHVRIVVRGEADGARTFTAELDLASYQLPGDAAVVIEAYRQTTIMRFDFGTVLLTRPPASCLLREFESTDSILFRVYVTDKTRRNGVLLGRAEQIRPREIDDIDNDRKPLLPVEPEDLGDEVWRVYFDAQQVVLQLNRKLDDWKQTAASPQFRSLVYPAILRQVLSRILLVDGYDEADDADDWRSNWLAFARTLPGMAAPIPKEPDEREEWIDSAAKSLSGAHSFTAMFEADSND